MAMRYVGLRVGVIAAVLALLAAGLMVAASPQAMASSTPSAPSYVWAAVGNGSLIVHWQNVPGATKYDVEYKSNGGSWHSAASNHTSSSITISGIDYTKAYLVRVRAGNGNGWSGWKNSNPTAPWTTERTVSTPIDDDSRKVLDDLNRNLRKYWGGNWGEASPEPTAATYMSVSKVASSSATLTLHHYDGAWSYKEASGGCVNKTSGTATVNLAGLKPETSHSYTAYPGSGCSRDSMALASFTTNPAPSNPHVTNLTTTSTGDSDNTSGTKQAVDFTTGPYSTGYTLTSVTIPMREKTAGTGTLAITLHAANSNGKPADSSLATLTGTPPTTSTFTNTTFTCSGSGCDLEGDTKYFVVATLTGTGVYSWSFSSEESQESTTPPDSGWDIGVSHFKNTGSAWNSWNDLHRVRIDFRYKN